MEIDACLVLEDEEFLSRAYGVWHLDAGVVDEVKQRYSGSGFRFDFSYQPVKLSKRSPGWNAYGIESRKHLDGGGNDFVVGVKFADAMAVRDFISRHAQYLNGAFADVELSQALRVARVQAVGDVGTESVRRALGLGEMTLEARAGSGVRVFIVDSGVTKQYAEKRGVSLVGGSIAGDGESGHGSMVAFDVAIAAPGATIEDFTLFNRDVLSVKILSMRAVRMYEKIIEEAKASPPRCVAVNSWGLLDRKFEKILRKKTGLREYSNNDDHPLNRIIGDAVDAGVDVLFSAGNCGNPGAEDSCGTTDKGKCHSINGANSHPKVITVGAVDIRGERLPYSSQGKGMLFDQKPDLMGFSEFLGSEVFGAGVPDSGTSAACPVVAGVVAMLRSTNSGRTLTPARMKNILTSTAKKKGAGWDEDMGFGVVSAVDALKEIMKIK